MRRAWQQSALGNPFIAWVFMAISLLGSEKGKRTKSPPFCFSFSVPCASVLPTAPSSVSVDGGAVPLTAKIHTIHVVPKAKLGAMLGHALQEPVLTQRPQDPGH